MQVGLVKIGDFGQVIGYISAMRSLSLAMSECSLSGRGQGHVRNFYIVDLVISPQQVVGIQVISTARPCWFVYDTYRTVEATRSRRG